MSDLQLAAIVATHDGVVAIHHSGMFGSRTRGLRLEAISATGARLWESDLILEDALSIREVAFTPAGIVVIVPQNPPETLQRLILVDIYDRSRRDISVPVSSINARPVANGLLLAGLTLDQPLLAFIDERGDIGWTRRLQLNDGPRFAGIGYYRRIDAQPFGTNGIAVIGNWTDRFNRTQLRVIGADAEGMSLALVYGRCLTADAMPIVTRERELLDDFGISVRLGAGKQVTERPSDSTGCALPSDAEYLSFLETLIVELTRLGATRLNQHAESIQISVDAFDTPFRLLDYAHNRIILDAPATVVRYVASVHAARQLAASIATTTQPHLVRMRATADEFAALARCRLSVERLDGSYLNVDDASYFEAIERAAEKVMAEARSTLPEILETSLEIPARCNFYFDDTGFGTFYETRPLDQVSDVLRDVLERTPR